MARQRLPLVPFLLVVWCLAATDADAQCAHCPNASFGPAIRLIGEDGGIRSGDSAIVADFDLDGIADIAVRQNRAVAVLLGRGAGAFAPAVVTPVTELDPNSTIVAGDFNEDGKPDLAVAIRGQGPALLLGGGNGRFLVGPSSPAGPLPYGVAVGDVDGDGHLDVVMYGSDWGGIHDSLTLFRGDGRGGLTQAGTFPTGRSSGLMRAFLATGDLNGDGHADVAAVDGYGGLVVLLGSASGFGPPIEPGLSGSGSGVVIGDATGDGKPDVVTSASFPFNTVVFPGDGAGGFGAPVLLVMGSWPRVFSVADLNGDGMPDLAAVGGQTGELVTRLGDGAGGFGSARSVYVGSSAGSLAVSDLDGDGVPDFVVGSGYGVSIATGDGAGGPATKTVAAGESPTSIAVADLDGDGKTDVLMTNDGSPNSLSVFRGLGSGDFAPPQVYTGYAGMLQWVVATDLTGDGKPDVLVTNGLDGTFTVLVNGGTGTLVSSTTLPIGCNPSGRPVVTDLNGDGHGDVAYPCDGSIVVRLGDGAGSFVAPVETAVNARWLAAGDVDDDGRVDLVSDSPYVGQVFVCLGDGNGNFGAPIGTNLPHYGAQGLVLADFDGDGRQDVATRAFSNGGLLDVVYGDGSGSFGRPRSFPKAVDTVTLAVDLNGDGHPDVVSVESPGFEVLMNDGSGGFLAPRLFVSGAQSSVAAGDLDGDGLTDLVLTDRDRDTFGVLLNTSCKARRLSFLPSGTACSAEGSPIAPSPVVRVLDDGENLVTCATGTVTASLVAGTAGATLGGTTVGPVAAGLATFTDLRIDLPGVYLVGFAHSGSARPAAGGLRLGSGVSVSVSGPSLVCGSNPAVYDAGAGFATYVWLLDGQPMSFQQTLTAPFLGPGTHTLSVVAGLGDCEGSASVTISNAPPTAASILPASGSRGGFTPVQVTGTCIASGATLKIDGQLARSVGAPSSTTVLGQTPPHAPGTVDVVLTNPDGQSATLPAAFTYLAGAGAYFLSPCRVFDTRLPDGPLGGPVFGSYAQRTFKVTGACGIPDGTVALLVNVTVTQPEAPGGIFIQSWGWPGPGIDFLAFGAGRTRANNGTVVLSTDGSGLIFVTNRTAGSAHVILDVTGYYY